MKTLQILKRARELVATSWTTGSFARSAERKSVPSTSTEACSWCAVGALRKATVECESFDWGFSDDYATARDAVNAEVPQNAVLGGLTDFNDAQADNKAVVALFDRAIAKLEAGQ